MALVVDDLAFQDEPQPIGLDDLLAFADTQGEPDKRWRLKAACRGCDTELFYCDGKTGDADVARKVCEQCEVRTECAFVSTVLEPEAYGTWGGLSELERRRLRSKFLKARGAPAPVAAAPSTTSFSKIIELNDLAWVDQHYTEEGLGTKEIGALLGCSSTTVVQALHRLGVPVRSRGWPRAPQAPITAASMAARARVTVPAGRRYPELADAAWLERRYVTEGATVKVIAKEVGCSPSSVYNRLDSMGIPRRPNAEYEGRNVKHPELSDSAWLTKAYVLDGLTSADIADQLGASPSAVVGALHRAGIPVRSKPQVAQQRSQGRVQAAQASAASVARCTVSAPSVAPTAPLPFTMGAIAGAFDAGMIVEEIAVATRTSVRCITAVLDRATA